MVVINIWFYLHIIAYKELEINFVNVTIVVLAPLPAIFVSIVFVACLSFFAAIRSSPPGSLVSPTKDGNAIVHY